MHQNLVIRQKNDYDLNNVLNNLSNHNMIIQHLQGVLDFYLNIDKLYARGLLLSKGININRIRLRNLFRKFK